GQAPCWSMVSTTTRTRSSSTRSTSMTRNPSRPNRTEVASCMLVASPPSCGGRQTACRGHEPHSGSDTPLKCEGPLNWLAEKRGPCTVFEASQALKDNQDWLGDTGVLSQAFELSLHLERSEVLQHLHHRVVGEAVRATGADLHADFELDAVRGGEQRQAVLAQPVEIARESFRVDGVRSPEPGVLHDGRRGCGGGGGVAAPSPACSVVSTEPSEGVLGFASACRWRSSSLELTRSCRQVVACG